MKKNFYWFACFACATVALAFSSCNDDKIEPDIEVPTEVTGVYILNGGDYGGNNAGISYLDSEGKVTEDIFKKQNNRALGDMGQHMIKYGSKLYVSMYGSKTVEILDAADATSLKQLTLTDDQGAIRPPRMFAAYNGKVYLTTFDGYVAKIDTASMAVEGYVKVGPNPDGITIANERIYTADTDGMNWPSQSTRVSVVDINSFEFESLYNINGLATGGNQFSRESINKRVETMKLKYKTVIENYERWKQGEIEDSDLTIGEIGLFKVWSNPWNKGMKYESTDHLKVPKTIKGDRSKDIEVKRNKLPEVEVYSMNGELLKTFRSSKDLEEWSATEFNDLPIGGRFSKPRMGKDLKLLQSGNINRACRTGNPYKNLIFKFKTKAPINSDVD